MGGHSPSSLGSGVFSNGSNSSGNNSNGGFNFSGSSGAVNSYSGFTSRGKSNGSLAGHNNEREVTFQSLHTSSGSSSASDSGSGSPVGSFQNASTMNALAGTAAERVHFERLQRERELLQKAAEGVSMLPGTASNPNAESRSTSPSLSAVSTATTTPAFSGISNSPERGQRSRKFTEDEDVDMDRHEERGESADTLLRTGSSASAASASATRVPVSDLLS